MSRHADAERFRRLHVIVGDSNMSETTMLLKVGATDLVLRMVEAGVVLRDMTLDNPIRAIREVSHDMTGRSRVRLANGREMSALDIQQEYLNRAKDSSPTRTASTRSASACLEMWERALTAIEDGDLDRIARRDRLGDQVPADRALPGQARPAAFFAARRPARPRLPRRAPRPGPVLPAAAERRGGPGDHRPEDLRGQVHPAQTTRAKLRGEFIRRAQDKRRDFTVDWVHLKLNDQAQRTVPVQGPVPLGRRARRKANRRHVGAAACFP